MVACLHFWHPEGVQQLADLLTELADVAVSKGVQPPFAEKNETAESLKKLSAKQLVEKFVKWLEREVPQITGVLKTSQVRVIGHVTDGEITYLVAKVAFEVEGEKTEQLDFYPLKKLGDEYRLMPKAEFGRVVRGWIKQIKNDR